MLMNSLPLTSTTTRFASVLLHFQIPRLSLTNLLVSLSIEDHVCLTACDQPTHLLKSLVFK